MKKHSLLLFFCLLSMCSMFAQLSATIGEDILLFPINMCIPMDNDRDTGIGETDPNRFRATVNGKDIMVKADTDLPAHVEIRRETTGGVVAKQDFIDETEITLPSAGIYTIRISSGNTAVEGRFYAK